MMVEVAPEVHRAVDALVELSVDGQVSERDLDRIITRLQVPAVAYREVVVELEERGIEVVHRDDVEEAEPQPARRRSASSAGSRDGFGHFLRTAGDHRILTAEEEVALGRRIQNAQRAAEYLKEHGSALSESKRQVLRQRIEDGDEARRELVSCNVRLAVFVAKRYFGRVSRLSMEMEDVVQEAILGLNRAAEKFDPGMGNKFSTYATWWLRQAISRGIENRGHLIRLPSHVHQAVAKMRSYIYVCETKQQDFDLAEAARRLGISEERAADILILATGGGVGAVRSLDIPIGDGADASLADFLEDDEAPTVEEEALSFVASDTIDQLLESRLTERERTVLRLRHGFDGEPLTLEEIGERFGLTRERIRQIQNQAMAKLKEPAVIKLLLAA